jgi:hypothetical protein
MSKTRHPGAFALLVLLCISLVSCGGDDASTSTSAAGADAAKTPTGGQAATTPGAKQGDGGGEKGKPAAGQDKSSGKGNGRRAAALPADPRRIPGAIVTPTGVVQTEPPSAPAHTKALDNSYASIKAFGEEPSSAETTEITAALQAYLSARARGEWPTACALLYSRLQEGLPNLAESGEQDAGCPAIIARLTSRAPQQTLQRQAEIDVAGVRREGERAFVIFSSADSVSADMPMYFEDGGWKVGALEAYALRSE